MSRESEDVGVIIYDDIRVEQLRYALPRHRFVAKRIGRFIILYHDIKLMNLSKEEMNSYLSAISKIKKIESDNITMIYHEDIESEMKGR